MTGLTLYEKGNPKLVKRVEKPRVHEYKIVGETLTREQNIVTELEGKIMSLPLPDIKGDLPTRTIRARSPIDAIRKYWKELGVEPRPSALYVDGKRYLVDWAGWNEYGSGMIGWWILLDESEYDQLRAEDGTALFVLPANRFLGVE